MNSLKKIPMLLNVCYGGYGCSEEAFKLYKERKNIKDDSDKSRYFFGLPRFDPIAIEIVRELGKKANDNCSKLKIFEIYEELKDYIDIHEYDGLESFSYELEKYKMDKIKEIVNSEISSDDKVKKITDVINFELPKEARD
jgi:intein/homing endonuclease